MVLEIGLIVETEIHIKIVGTEGTIKTIIIMVLEAIDLEIEITNVTGLITEGKILTKIMAKEIETEA